MKRTTQKKPTSAGLKILYGFLILLGVVAVASATSVGDVVTSFTGNVSAYSFNNLEFVTPGSGSSFESKIAACSNNCTIILRFGNHDLTTNPSIVGKNVNIVGISRNESRSDRPQRASTF